jgi:urease accessory protein
MGLALQRLLTSLEIPNADIKLDKPVCFITMLTLAGSHWKISLTDLAHGFVWSWLENQVAAATKTVPLGQTQAQKLLVRLMEDIPPVCNKAELIVDDEIGVGLPAVAIASARHERQYSRLFRS